MDRTVHRTVIDRNTVPNLRKPYKIRYRITVNRTVHRRVTTLVLSIGLPVCVCVRVCVCLCLCVCVCVCLCPVSSRVLLCKLCGLNAGARVLLLIWFVCTCARCCLESFCANRVDQMPVCVCHSQIWFFCTCAQCCLESILCKPCGSYAGARVLFTDLVLSVPVLGVV
jgi:hypothetical protein